MKRSAKKPIRALRPLPAGKWRHPDTGDVLTVLREGAFGEGLQANDFLVNGCAPKADAMIEQWVVDLLRRRVEPESVE